MDVDRTTDEPTPGPAKLPCPHVWTQLTPTTAQCQRCLFTVPTLAAPGVEPPTPEAEPEAAFIRTKKN